MSYKFEVHVGSSMMRKAWNAWFFAKGLAWKLPIALAIIMAPVFMKPQSDRSDTTSAICLTSAAIILIGFVLAYLLGLRRSMDKLNTIVDGKASYTLSDPTIEASSSLGSVSLAWCALSEVRVYGDLVLLGFRGAMYSVVPRDQVSQEALDFLFDRAENAGAKIRK